jgi:16S rRNA (guanine(966)-N(2))-methyltransferase RsmD
MRIIAGEFRGRRLRAPATLNTRPITDRAKQSLFDILSPHVDGSRVYDCFAGTGSMGVECLSRGAQHVTFFESDRSAVALLRHNLASLKIKTRWTLVTQDLFKWFAARREVDNLTHLIFIDPPYHFVRQRTDALRQLVQRVATDHLDPGGIVVFRHDSRDRLELPPLVGYDQRQYGGMTIEFLRIP